MKNLTSCWYKNFSLLCWLLVPFSLGFRIIIVIRRLLYQLGLKKSINFNVPVIVVGNITVGGTGKTPLVIALVNFLKQNGYKPGIVSRGYGGLCNCYPYVVNQESSVVSTGDEAILIFQQTQCPLAIDINRVKAAEVLLKTAGCDMIISDDGLQHYALKRDIEIAVIDGDRRFGNGFLLPAGPLREPITRLREVDFVIVNGGVADKSEYSMQLISDKLYNVADSKKTKSLSELKNQTVHAVAGIGNPQRFFNMLKSNGINIIEHPFPDHYRFKSNDLHFSDNLLILMTEKDAVKYKKFAGGRHWCVAVKVVINDNFFNLLMKKL